MESMIWVPGLPVASREHPGLRDGARRGILVPWECGSTKHSFWALLLGKTARERKL